MIQIVTDHRCLDYRQPGHPERPERVQATLARLEASDLPIEFTRPSEVTDDQIDRAHTQRLIESLAEEIDFDADTPAYPDIAAHARRSAGGALRAMEAALAGHFGFSLLRPPGHHATRRRAMGFCYLNQVAIAALDALARGLRVAVFDFDVHHGNGTEDILHGVPECAFWSIHQFPAYPGTGASSRGNCTNFPMAPQTPRAAYQEVVKRALDQMLRFAPDLIAISAGFDAFSGDPLGQENLEGEDYYAIGEWIADSSIPAFAVLEGGYSDELPDLVHEFLSGAWRRF